MTVIIRDTSADDTKAITEIYADHVKHGLASFEYDVPDHAEMLRRFETLTDNGYPHLVAEQDGALVGYAYAGPFHARKAYERTVEDSVYLAENAQGQGIGTQLLERLILECRRREYRQIVAVISKLDPPTSIKLHEKTGFDYVGTLKDVGFKKGQWIDVVYMQLSLFEMDSD